jgi:hypothetical protein
VLGYLFACLIAMLTVILIVCVNCYKENVEDWDLGPYYFDFCVSPILINILFGSGKISNLHILRYIE